MSVSQAKKERLSGLLTITALSACAFFAQFLGQSDDTEVGNLKQKGITSFLKPSAMGKATWDSGFKVDTHFNFILASNKEIGTSQVPVQNRPRLDCMQEV